MCATAMIAGRRRLLKCYEKVNKKKTPIKAGNARSTAILLQNTRCKDRLISMINNLYTPGGDRTLTSVLL